MLRTFGSLREIKKTVRAYSSFFKTLHKFIIFAFQKNNTQEDAQTIHHKRNT